QRVPPARDAGSRSACRLPVSLRRSRRGERLQLFHAGIEADDFALRAQHADRVAPGGDSIHSLMQQLAEQHDAAIGGAERLAAAVGDETLTFLRGAVLLVRGQVPPAVLDALIDTALGRL